MVALGSFLVGTSPPHEAAGRRKGKGNERACTTGGHPPVGAGDVVVGDGDDEQVNMKEEEEEEDKVTKQEQERRGGDGDSSGSGGGGGGGDGGSSNGVLSLANGRQLSTSQQIGYDGGSSSNHEFLALTSRDGVTYTYAAPVMDSAALALTAFGGLLTGLLSVGIGGGLGFRV